MSQTCQEKRYLEFDYFLEGFLDYTKVICTLELNFPVQLTASNIKEHFFKKLWIQFYGVNFTKNVLNTPFKPKAS